MVPGEVMVADGEIELNAGAEAVTLMVANTGDRPVQVGSHYHFAETNNALDFDRDAAPPSSNRRFAFGETGAGRGRSGAGAPETSLERRAVWSCLRPFAASG